jgi:hypothetical protein
MCPELPFGISYAKKGSISRLTDGCCGRLIPYLSSFHEFSSFIGDGDHSPILSPSVLQTIPHHAESLTELNMQGGSKNQISDLTVCPGSNLLSSVKDLQYFGLQLHISIIVSNLATTTV